MMLSKEENTMSINISRKEELADLLVDILLSQFDSDFITGLLEMYGCDERDLRILGIGCE